MKTDYLAGLREGQKLTLKQQLSMIVQLSFPAIMAYMSNIVMQYIDASMVGRLGAEGSASIGLVASSTWLFGGMCSAAVTGFTVQTAQRIGAGQECEARSVMKQGFVIAMAASLFWMLLGTALSGGLPAWLGGGADITANASAYFLIFCLALPFSQLNNISGGMLQASGNMRLPSVLHILMCGLDIVFNWFLIFPTRRVLGITVPGAGMGVAGAALGTALAQAVTACIMAYALLKNSPTLHLRRGESLRFNRRELAYSVKLSIPVALEQLVMSGAQVMSTRIVAPLGTVSIAANSFAVTVEGLAYMPGYGIGMAASTMIGQSTGAGRRDLTFRLGWLTTLLGMAVMTVMGVAMYITAPWMLALLTPVAEVQALGTLVLRIEAFAEPMYAASIVASGALRGAGDTLVSSCLNFCSMWIVRLPLAAILAPRMGLRGVWVAMCIELCVRGILFLIRLADKRWMKHGIREAKV